MKKQKEKVYRIELSGYQIKLIKEMIVHGNIINGLNKTAQTQANVLYESLEENVEEFNSVKKNDELFDFDKPETKSYVKLIKNTKGINLEIKEVLGDENKMDNLIKSAIINYKNAMIKIDKIIKEKK